MKTFFLHFLTILEILAILKFDVMATGVFRFGEKSCARFPLCLRDRAKILDAIFCDSKFKQKDTEKSMFFV